ncbi:unnamed protein product, partial [Musa textilis]
MEQSYWIWRVNSGHNRGQQENGGVCMTLCFKLNCMFLILQLYLPASIQNANCMNRCFHYIHHHHAYSYQSGSFCLCHSIAWMLIFLFCQQGWLNPLWVAFAIIIGGLMLDVLISVSLGISSRPVN